MQGPTCITVIANCRRSLGTHDEYSMVLGDTMRGESTPILFVLRSIRKTPHVALPDADFGLATGRPAVDFPFRGVTGRAESEAR
jgi:hypothetical protein